MKRMIFFCLIVVIECCTVSKMPETKIRKHNQRIKATILTSEDYTSDEIYMEEAMFNAIQGGKVTVIDSMPYQVLIEISRVDKCSGTLIAPQWVVTACHCLFDKFGYRVDKDEIKVHAGISDRFKDRGGAGHQARNVSKIVWHPDFTLPNLYSVSRFDSDIALLKLSRPFDFTSNVVKFATIPAQEDATNGSIYPNLECIISGWGRLTDGGAGSDNIVSAKVNIVKNEIAANQYKDEVGLAVTDNMLATYLTGVDACQGDSGGPLVVRKFKSSKGIMANCLIGVISYGKGCGKPGYCGMYSNVAKFSDWILDNILEIKMNSVLSSEGVIMVFELSNISPEQTITWYLEGKRNQLNGTGPFVSILVKKDDQPFEKIIFSVDNKKNIVKHF